MPPPAGHALPLLLLYVLDGLGVHGRVVLPGLAGGVQGVNVMAVGDVGVVAGPFVVSGIVVCRRFPVMASRVLVVLGRLAVVLRAVVGLHSTSWNGVRRMRRRG